MFDGNMKNRRDVSMAKDAGYIQYPKLQGHIKSGCTHPHNINLNTARNMTGKHVCLILQMRVILLWKLFWKKRPLEAAILQGL